MDYHPITSPGTQRRDGRDGGIVVDCDVCRMRDTAACQDCVVSVLLSDGPLELDPDERQALDTLAEAGLVPRLRLVRPDDDGTGRVAV